MAEDSVDDGVLRLGARNMDRINTRELSLMGRAGVGNAATGLGDAGEVRADVGNTSAGVDAGGMIVDGTRRDVGGEDIADGIDIADVFRVVRIGHVSMLRVFLINVDGIGNFERIVVIGDLSTNTRNVVRSDASNLEVVRTIDGERDGRGLGMGRRCGGNRCSVFLFYTVERSNGGA